MSDITVRALGVEEWEQYRTVRLDALQESPDAFVASLDEEKGYDEDFWRLRLQRSERLLAEVDGRTVGVASVGQSKAEGEEENPRVAELFGLWVAPEARGTGVATRLVAGRRRHRPPAGPQPPRLLGGHRQRPGRRVRQRLRLPSRPTSAAR